MYFFRYPGPEDVVYDSMAAVHVYAGCKMNLCDKVHVRISTAVCTPDSCRITIRKLKMQICKKGI